MYLRIGAVYVRYVTGRTEPGVEQDNNHPNKNRRHPLSFDSEAESALSRTSGGTRSNHGNSAQIQTVTSVDAYLTISPPGCL